MRLSFCRLLLTIAALSTLLGLSGCSRPQKMIEYRVTSTVKGDIANITYVDEHEQRHMVERVKLPFLKTITVGDGAMLVLSCQGHNPAATYHETILCGEDAATLSPLATLQGDGTDPFVINAQAGGLPEKKDDPRRRENKKG